MFDVIYLIIPLIILLIILLIITFNKTENFTNEFKKIKYYIIHLERSIDRLENLDIQIKKLNKDIIYFPAIDGNTLDYNKLLENNIIQKEYWNRIQKKVCMVVI
jgi:hypothetical protein